MPHAGPYRTGILHYIDGDVEKAIAVHFGEIFVGFILEENAFERLRIVQVVGNSIYIPTVTSQLFQSILEGFVRGAAATGSAILPSWIGAYDAMALEILAIFDAVFGDGVIGNVFAGRVLHGFSV